MEKSSPKKHFRVVLIVSCIILACIVVAMTGLAIYVTYLYSRMEYVGQDTTLSPEEAASIVRQEAEKIDPDSTESLPDENDIAIKDEYVYQEGQGSHIVNIMLVGQDAREGESVQRSDTMMLVTFDRKTRTITLTSLMRDQYVKIPGYGSTKLNHAYKYGGMSLMNKTLSNHFGIEVDGNFEVDFTGFEKIIDRLGGVEIDLTEEEADYLKEKGFKNVKVGKNILEGESALWYARLRSIDTDYARAERQRNVMISLFEAYKELSYPQMLSLLHDILPLVRTNMTISEITGYAMQLYPMLTGAEVDTLRIPMDGTFKEGYVKVYEGKKLWCQYNIDFEANRKELEKVFE